MLLKINHPSTLHPAKTLVKLGFKVEEINVNYLELIKLKELESKVRNTAWLTLLANITIA